MFITISNLNSSKMAVASQTSLGHNVHLVSHSLNVMSSKEHQAAHRVRQEHRTAIAMVLHQKQRHMESMSKHQSGSVQTTIHNHCSSPSRSSNSSAGL